MSWISLLTAIGTVSALSLLLLKQKENTMLQLATIRHSKNQC